jgi:hypothetical protein
MFVRIYAPEGRRLPQTFEAFSEILATWTGMFVEPDGSFVWAQSSGELRRQLDGMIYDRDGAIEYLELKGDSTSSDWERICAALTSPIGKDEASWDRILMVHDIAGERWVTPSHVRRELDAGN